MWSVSSSAPSSTTKRAGSACSASKPAASTTRSRPKFRPAVNLTSARNAPVLPPKVVEAGRGPCNTWTVAALQVTGLPVSATGVVFAAQGVAKIVRSSGGIEDALGIETATNAAGSPFLVCSQIVPQQLFTAGPKVRILLRSEPPLWDKFTSGLSL